MAGTDLLHPSTKKKNYETRDVDVKRVSIFTVGILLLTAAALPAMMLLFNHFADEATRTQPRSRTLVPREANPEPPAPRLQTTPTLDLAAHRREESEKRDSYHWIDRSTGRVAIPVERAMELVVARGLPARPAARRGTIPPQAPAEPQESAAQDPEQPQGHGP